VDVAIHGTKVELSMDGSPKGILARPGTGSSHAGWLALAAVAMGGCGARSDLGSASWASVAVSSGEADAGDAGAGVVAAPDASVGGEVSEDGGVNGATSCAGNADVFMEWSDTASLIRPPLVDRSSKVSVTVGARVNGLPSVLEIGEIDPSDSINYDTSFSTGTLNTSLLPGRYVVTSGLDGPGPKMEIGANGIGGPVTGVFEVIEMKAVPVADTPGAPPGLISFLVTFDLPWERTAGCLHFALVN
jgi:hypothetical protein